MCFANFEKVAFETMSKLVSFILGTSWTNMEAQEVFVLKFPLNLFLERENGPFCLFDFFFFLLISKVFFLFTFCIKC